MARVFGIEMLHMAQTDVLPYDYALYGHEIEDYLVKAGHLAEKNMPGNVPDLKDATAAARRFTAAGEAIASLQRDASLNPESLTRLNRGLRDAERALLLDDGLPKRPWFKHAIYAPGEYTGYAAVVIPGVNEAIDANDGPRVQQQAVALAAALNRAAEVLETCYKAARM